MSGLTLLAHYEPLLLKGFEYTVYLSVLTIVSSSVIGLLFGILSSTVAGRPRRTLAGRVARRIVRVYVGVFRAIPLLVLLFIIYFGLPGLIGVNIGMLLAAAVGISVFYGAYLTEVVRSGIEGVPREQLEASQALGLGRGQSLRLVILPQALRVSVPIATTQWVATIKDTSLASAIGVIEITAASMTVQQLTFSASASWEILGFLALIYLLLTLGMSALGRMIERWLRRGERNVAETHGFRFGPTPLADDVLDLSAHETAR